MSDSRPSPRPLKHMFEAVPKRYDLLNRLLTLRLDERWRRRAARHCLEDDPQRVLDLCCGTGDLTIQLARQARHPVEIIGLDFSPAMLEVAGKKAAASGLGETLGFVEGDASAMQYPDNHFDAAGIAFAFRNLTWRNPLRDKALAEVLRVLRPGGRFVVVETSQPKNRVLRAGFHAYLRGIVAPLGKTISRHKSAYRYLSESAKDFYNSGEVEALLTRAGFTEVRAKRLMGGVAAIHLAHKPRFD